MCVCVKSKLNNDIRGAWITKYLKGSREGKRVFWGGFKLLKRYSTCFPLAVAGVGEAGSESGPSGLLKREEIPN